MVVKARAYLDGLRAVAEGDTVHLTGTLRDNLGTPVPGVEVRVAARQASAQATTDGSGRFEVDLDVPGGGRAKVAIEWPGGDWLAPAGASLDVAVGRTEVQLALDVPDAIDAGAVVHLGARASDANGEALADLPLRARLGEQSIDGHTHSSGQLGLTFAPLEAGVHRLTVDFAGDKLRLPARATKAIAVTRPLTVELGLRSATPLEPGAPIVFDAHFGEGTPDGVRAVLTADG
ncbi:MAG: carboxypeptidase regulatory-like domain-containing protein, partial [Myxococcales bacterium]|nr:carboxypeptidase regulatory-like domain-containing protein [Myxococcales bacterium]